MNSACKPPFKLVNYQVNELCGVVYVYAFIAFIQSDIQVGSLGKVRVSCLITPTGGSIFLAGDEPRSPTPKVAIIPLHYPVLA